MAATVTAAEGSTTIFMISLIRAVHRSIDASDARWTRQSARCRISKLSPPKCRSQSIGDRLRWQRRAKRAGFQRVLRIAGEFGFGQHNLGGSVNGEHRARGQSAAADRYPDLIQAGTLFQELERGRSRTRDDPAGRRTVARTPRRCCRRPGSTPPRGPPGSVRSRRSRPRSVRSPHASTYAHCVGTTMIARRPDSAAARASAAPWLPDECVATVPTSFGSRATAFVAPRILKEPARCRFSHLKTSSTPSNASSVRLVSTGVRCTRPSIRCAAATTSARSGITGACSCRAAPPCG